MDLMVRRRQLMGMQPKIQPPLGYKFIEYAKSVSGSARVTLPYGFYKTDILDTYAAIDYVNYVDKFLYAPDIWNDRKNRFAMVGGYLTYCFGVGYGAATTPNALYSPTYRDDLFHRWVYKDYAFSITDINYTKDFSNVEFVDETSNIQMFYGYNANTSGKIAYFKQKKADGRKLYVLPIQNETTGEVRMYDVVSKTIMPQTGTLYPPEE